MDTSPRTFLTWRYAGGLIAVTPVVVWWLERLAALPTSGWFAPSTAFALGGDLRTYHSAAYLAVHNHGSLIYDYASFRDFFAADPHSFGPFVNPPPFLALIAPLGWLSFEAAWFVVTLLSIAGIVVGLRWLGVRRLALGAAAALLFPPVYFAITFGQASLLWFVIMAGVYRLLRDERTIPAGLVAGLLVMKPPLAVGLAVWWLLDWKRYWRAILAAVSGGVAYLLASYLIVADAWSGYLGSFFDLLHEPEFPPRQWAQFSPWSTWKLLFPSQSALAIAAGVLSLIVVVVAIVPPLTRATHLDAAFSGVVLLTMLAAPYLIAYDWTLLIIPGVLLWRRIDWRERLAPAMVIVTIVAAWSTSLVNLMLDSGDAALQIAPLVLLGVVWYHRDLISSERLTSPS